MSVRVVLLFLTLITLALPVAFGFVRSNQGAASATETTEAIPQDFAAIAARLEAAAQSNTTTTSSGSTISALGTIEANEVAEVSFLVAGKIEEVMVEAGDTVSKGDLLAWLDGTDAQVAYDQARLNLERARINLADLYEPPTDAELRVADANIASAQAAYSAAANVTSESDLETSQLRYEQALNTYNAQAAARANMSGTEEEIALQDAAVGAASFNLEIARLQLEELNNPSSSNLWSAGIRIRQAQLQKEQLLAEPTQAEIDSAEIAVQRAEQQLAEAETALRRTQILAPMSGVVTAVTIEPGDTVTSGTAVIEISDLSQLWLTAPVHEVDVDQLRAGMAATVTLDALPDVEIPATVEQIAWLSTVTDDIVNYDTRFALNTDDARIRVGMTAQAVVDAAS